MNRRGFLGALLGGAAIAAADPERLLAPPPPAPVPPIAINVISSVEIRYSLLEFEERYICPAMLQLANEMDRRALMRWRAA